MAAKIEKKGESIVRKLFKSYDQNQEIQVPILLVKLIPESHLVRIVNKVVDQIEMSELESYYKGDSSSAYHPKLLIKVWLYGYCEQIYTSRRLSKMIRENINFMWLSGHQQPCFKTLNSFRSGPLSDMVDLVFKEVLKLLIDLDYIDINDLYVDGSKWEANGNRHKVVWRKNTERYKKTVIARIELLLADIKQLQQEEEDKHGKEDLSELGKGRDLRVVITSEMVNAQLTHLSSLVSAESARHKSRMESVHASVSRLKK